MYSFVARQPILDAKMRTYAYELLFRQGLSNAFPNISSEKATITLLEEQFLSQPIESLVGDKISFVNFPYSLIIEGIIDSLPPKKVVIEILEDASPNDTLLNSVISLKQRHYTIALDDFTMDPAWDRFLPFIDIIKFDWRLSTRDEIQKYIDDHRPALENIKLLAEKIETREEFEIAKNMGFKLFQGYFFSKPEVVKSKTLSANQVVVTQLFTETIKENVDYDKIEKILSQDQSLAYKLLSYVNNVRYGTSDPITSFRHAVVFLGKDNMRRFISLVYATCINENKASELSKMSLVRARFCELIAVKRQNKVDPQDAFMCGLFSLLDAMMDRPFSEIISSMPIRESIKQALIDKKGELAFYIGLVLDYETLNWPRVKIRVQKLGIDEQEAIDTFLEATKWANKILSE
ncbi:MAG: HDOD domain-containing protein [Succinivibrionaceae bacterium]|nr:HDOD domain-containing protein [Succinivibrionaceae bacterium]